MEPVNIHELVERLSSDEDGVRKMAVFRLQSAVADPAFADGFIVAGGLSQLQHLTMNASGNTLAYSLSAFSKLLEVDKGWDAVDTELVKRVVELVVTHPLVNVLRGAMSVLAAVVAHPSSSAAAVAAEPDKFGFRALKPAIAEFPEFLEMLVNRLSTSDHALCANALQLINSLMLDAITHGSDQEWPKFIKRLQDLGVIRAVYGLMQSSALADVAHPLLEFQALTKMLVRKWRDVPVDFEKTDHRRALKGIHLSSLAEGEADEKTPSGKTKRHAAPDWKKLGFSEDGPAEEFEEVGFLGMMDLTDYVRKNESGFQRLLLEQAAQSEEKRCPMARASIAVTSILYEHFEVDKADIEDAKEYLVLDTRSGLDKLFRPMLLQWSKVHTAGLTAFVRLWKATGATIDDFAKVAELVRILLEAVLGGAQRHKEVHSVEEEIQTFTYQRLRELQMELFELSYEQTWGTHLTHVREELKREALAFIKEQRIRCLLAGSWFKNIRVTKVVDQVARESEFAWGYVKLSHNRRHLHYAGFESKTKKEFALEELPERVDLHVVSSVVSNVTATPPSPGSSTSTVHLPDPKAQQNVTAPRIAINGMATTGPPEPARTSMNGTALRPSKHQRQTSKQSSQGGELGYASSVSSVQRRELSLLTIHPGSHGLAAEWLDGLLMLMKQPPITEETRHLLSAVSSWGLKIRLLNVRYDDDQDGEDDKVDVPSREGLDEDYYYDMFAG